MNAENQLTDARRRVEQAAGGDRHDVIGKLAQAERELAVSVPVPRDSGGVDYFPGFRVQYDTTRGPGKGGVRYHPSVTMEEVRLLGFLMTIKNALLDLPFGGAKGGVQVDVRKLSDREVEALSRNLVRLLARDLGPRRDVPAPDAYTNPRIMGWMEDEFANLQKEHVPAVVTGKPVGRGGTALRLEATALGASHVVKKACVHFDWDPESMTVAIQGFGNAGSHLARLLEQAGFTVVAASDSKGGIYCRDGLKVADLVAAKEKGSLDDLYAEGSVCDCEGDDLSGDDILELEVDLLVPAALGGVIHADNVERVKAGAVIEVANAALEQDAHDRLVDRGVVVIPDVLANAGGVVASYFEWSNNLSGVPVTEEEQWERLQAMMNRAFDRVADAIGEEAEDWRSAAYAVAVKAIGDALVVPGAHE